MCVRTFSYFPKDAVLRVHLADNSTTEGRFVRKRRGYVHLQNGRIEANGKLHDVDGVVCVPIRNIKLVQVLG